MRKLSKLNIIQKRPFIGDDPENYLKAQDSYLNLANNSKSEDKNILCSEENVPSIIMKK
jgi:hypothetical protein